MEAEGNSNNFNENQQGNDKVTEKSNLGNSAANINSPYSNRKNIKTSSDESSNFERNKKLCTWQPPIKNERASVPNELSVCVNAQQNVNSSVSTMPANVESVLPEISAVHSQSSPEHLHENDKCELSPNFMSCSTILNMKVIFDNNQDCDQEIYSISSVETLPTEIEEDERDDLIYNLNKKKIIPSANKNKEKINFANSDHDYVNNIIEKDTVTYENEEHISQVTENKVKFSNLERMEKLGTNLVLSEEIAMTVLNANDTENKQLKWQTLYNEKYAKEMGNFYDTNCYTEDKISDNTFRSIHGSGSSKNSGIQEGNYTNTVNANVINQQNIPQTKNTIISEPCNNTFDLTFTSSQFKKLECDDTTAVYNSYTNKSNNFWMRRKKEQKNILQKVIKEIDAINNSIVQATNELRTQFCKNIPK